MRELSDDEVFGSTAELSDDEVFGAAPVVSKPSTSLAMPVLDPFGLSRPSATTTPRVSVLQDLPPDPQAFDMRKASAVRNAIATTPAARGRQFMSEGLAVDEGFIENAARVARKVLGGINESTAGIVRNAADLVGADSVADFARRSSRASRAFAGKTVAAPVSIDGFAPGSIVQDLPEAAENAAVSIGQQLPAMATGSVPTALGIMVAQSYGQQYNKVRDSGLDVMPGMANAGLTAVFEYLGERFGGLPQQMSGLSQAFAGNRPAAALRDLAAGGLKEVPGEALVTYPGQYLVDTLPGIGTNGDPTIAQFLDGFKDTVLTASLQGGAMAGAGTAVAEARQQFARLNPEQQLAAASRILAMVERDAPLPGQPDAAAPQAPAPEPEPVAPLAPVAIPDELAQSIVGAIAQADESAASRRQRAPEPQAAEVELTEAEVFGAEQTATRPAQSTQESAPLPADAPASPDPQGVAANDQGAATPDAAAPTTGPDALAAPSAPLQVEQPKPPASLIAQQQPGAAPVRLGIGSQPLEEGGQPFADKATAQREKKQHPGLRVVRVEGGYALADKTPAQLAAEAKATARIKGANAGTGSAPISAHEFIVRRGGLDQSTMADVGFDRNHRVGNRTLFAGKGKPGLTLEQATQALREAGYLTEDDINAAAELIRKSVRTPQYTPEGWERIAQAENETRYQDHLDAQAEVDDDPFEPLEDYAPELEATGAAGLDPATRAEYAALLAALEGMGVDTESLIERAAHQTENESQHEYHARILEIFRNTLAESAGSRSDGEDRRGDQGQPGQAEREGGADGGPHPGAQGPAGELEGLTSPTEREILNRLERIETVQREQAERDRQADQRARADRERDEFRLTGSDRAADANADQGGLLDVPADLGKNEGTDVEQPRQPYSDDRQTELDLELERYQGEPNRSGQTGAGVASARGDGVTATLDLFATGDVFGQKIARELASKHLASLIGRRVDSPEEFATVAQVYRDRRFETFRVVYLDDQNRVISQLGMTSRLPASAAAIAGDDVAEYFDELTRVARNVGASGFYLLHNHPSGSAAASAADQSLTRRYAQEMRGRAPGVKFMGHVVIDTNQYSVLDADGRPTLHHKDFGAIEPVREGEFSGLRLSDPADVMALAKRIEVDESAVTLILTNSQLHVERITTIPRSAVTDDEAGNRRSLARALLQNNASKAVAISHDYKALKQLSKLTLDGIYVPADGGKPASLAEMGVHPGGDVFGRERRTRITSDTSADFRGMRRLTNIEAVRKGLPFPKVAEPGADYNALPEPPQEPPRRTRLWNPIGRDALGNVKFAWGEVALDVANAALAPIMTRFGMRMATPELRRQLRQMKATIEEANRQASEVAKAMSGMVEADRELVSDLVEKMLKPGVVPPEHVVRVADAITRSMDRQTDELLELGMLTPQSAERWRGQYLPRLYRKYQDDLLQKDATWLQRLFKTAQPLMRGLKADSLKARGLFEEVSVSEAPQWISMGYELRDSHWRLNQGELELRNPDITPPAAREKVVVWRDFTREEREEMGEMRDALLRYVQGYTAMQRDIAAGRLFDNIANNPEWVRRSGSTGWTRVPDTEIPGTAGVKRYGNLAGLWVREDIMAHLTQFEEAGNDALQLWRDALGLWKEGKTALNPVAHFNNIVSNVSMAHFAGVSYWDVHKYVAAVRDLVNDAPMLEEGRQVGLFTGSFTKEELIQSLPKELQDLMKLPEAALKRAGRQFWNALTFWLRTPLRNAYEFEDVFFKYVIYREARGRGLSPEEATDYALRYIFTYDDLPSGARKVRDYAIPFFAWSYKAIPALLHTAMHYPWRFLAPAGVLHGVNLAAYALAAGDEGDDWLEKIAKGRALEEEERSVLPERMRGQGALLNPKSIRLGYDNLTGHPIFMDVSRVIPGGDMFDMENQSGGLPIPAPLMPNHPVLGLFSSMVANRELFMGRDLVDRNDTAAEAFEKRAKWMAGFILPAVAPGGYHSQRLADALASAADITISTPLGEFTGVDRAGQPVQPGFAALQTVGVKARPIDLDLERERRGADSQALVRSITAEVRSMARLHQRGAATDKMLERTREVAREKLDRIREERP